MEPSLELLLNKRDYDYMTFTKKLIDMFGAKLSKAVQMHYKIDRTITWYKCDRFNAIEGFVLVMGDVEIQPGDMIRTPDGDIVATLENKHTLSNTVRYILSSKVLQHGTVEAIYQHVIFVETLAREATEEQIYEILSNEVFDTNTLIENPEYAGILNKITRPTTFESFDTSELTEEQYNSLRLCAGISPKKSKQ